MDIIFMAIGAFVLFMIITYAVKMAVKSALYEFKEDVVKEFGLKRVNEEDRNETSL